MATINGTTSNDVLIGTSQDDLLDGGAGADTMTGAQGNDIYVVDNVGDLVVENADEGLDAVQSSVNYVLEANIENLTLLGDASSGTGNDLDNVLVSTNQYGCSLDGGIGNDMLFGAGGFDLLIGGQGNDTLDGGAGDDLLLGGAGANTYMFGIGSGRDSVLIDTSSTDVVLIGSGVLPDNVTAVWGGYNADDLVLSINGATDTLTIINFFGSYANPATEIRFSDGTAWNLSTIPLQAGLNLQGGPGNDILLGGQAGDILVGGEGDDLLDGGSGNDILDGGYGNDILYGGQGNDNLDGGAGNDLLNGGGGDDTYHFDMGSGQDTIDYNQPEGFVRVQLGAGLTVGNVTASRVTNNPDDLILTVNGSTDSLTIKGYFMNPWATSVSFAAGGAMLDMNVLASLPILMEGTEESDCIMAPNRTNPSTVLLTDAILNGNGGDDYMSGADGNDKLNGGSGNDWLDGGLGDDTLDGGSGNDVLNGGDGFNTYLFDLGGGQDSIDNALPGGFSLVQLGAGLTTGNVTASRVTNNPDDLILTVNGSTDSLTVKGYFMNPWTTSISFTADGTMWDMNTIAILTNRLPNATADDIAANQSGSVTVSVAQLLANDTDPEGGNLNMVGFDAVTVQGNAVTQDANGNLVISISTNYRSLGAGQTAADSFNYTIADDNGATSTAAVNITITGTNDAPVVTAALIAQSIAEGQPFSYVLPSNSYGDVDVGDVLTYSARLANGSALPAWMSFNAATRTFSGTPGSGSLDNLNIVVTATDSGGLAASSSFTLSVNPNAITGTTAKNTLNGTVYDDFINGLAGADTMKGGLGNDTYVIDNTGDTVTELANQGTDTIRSAVTRTLGSNVENLILTGTSAINGTDNTLNNVLTGNGAVNTLSGGSGNDILQGAAGNDILKETAGANVLDGGAGTDNLTGNSGKEFFIGGTGNDTITTGNGTDILAFNRGDGADIVNGGTGTDNTISLGGGITYSDLALSKVNNNLILEVGGGEQITLSNWYKTGANYKSVLDLQVMADAMAAFDPNSADPLLNQAVQNFNFTAVVNAFDQARGTSSTFMHWSATNTLLAAHLSGSDTTALGGDLAHQYGTNGSLTGMNLTAAQAALNDAQFGGAPQGLQPLQGLQGGAVTL